MGFEINIEDFSKLFGAFGFMLAFLWGLKKALELIK
jgi:flagellar biogenesis protein FliO